MAGEDHLEVHSAFAEKEVEVQLLVAAGEELVALEILYLLAEEQRLAQTSGDEVHL